MTDLPDKLDALAREYGPPRFRGDLMPDTLREAAAEIRHLRSRLANVEASNDRMAKTLEYGGDE